MRRVVGGLLVVGASAGLVALLLGAGALMSHTDRETNAAPQVRGWTVDGAATRSSAPAEATGPSPAPSELFEGAAAQNRDTAVRDVTPPTVTPPPAVSGPLIRLEAPRPAAPPPEPWLDVLFHRPWIGPDLSLAVRPSGAAATAPRVEIRLAGISPLDEATVCKDALGDEGPCRAVAAAALRALIGAKGIECLAPRKTPPPRLTTTCRIGNRDLGSWLVERGYARGASPAAAVSDTPQDAN